MSAAPSTPVELTHKDIALLCMGLAYLAGDAAGFPLGLAKPAKQTVLEARDLLYRLEAAGQSFTSSRAGQ